MRLTAAASRAQEAEAAAEAQRAEAEALGQQVAGMEAAFGALREEYHAVTDDLAALVKENQASVCWLQSFSAWQNRRLPAQAAACMHALFGQHALAMPWPGLPDAGWRAAAGQHDWGAPGAG